MTDVCRSNNPSQITDWWQEAEQAVRLGQIRRARRFLRWIVSCCPEEEEGWLVLAELASDSQEQIPILRGAYRFHPHSQRVQAALRQARQRHLESSVGELKVRRAVPRLLPDERQLAPQAHARSSNGHKPPSNNGHHPPHAGDTWRPWPLPFLARLFQREPVATGNGHGQVR